LAAEVLSLMSFFDRQDILEALLRRRQEVEEAGKRSHGREVLRIRRLGRFFAATEAVGEVKGSAK
jgi:hypothetical protein